MADNDLRHAPEVFVDTLRHFSSLMQSEMRLAKAEVRSNLSRAVTGLVFFGVAAILLLVALNVLASSAVAALVAWGLSVGWASALVGAGLLVCALVLVLVGKSRLSANALEPSRTVDNIKRDVAAAREVSHV